MKKILHISETFEGGGNESVFRDTLNVSEKLGFINDYFVSEGKVSPFSYIFSFPIYYKLKEKLTSFMPDVIHIHNYYHYLTPSILKAIREYKKKKGCKVIFTAHDYHLICPNSGLQFFENDKRYSFDWKINSIRYNKKFDHRSWLHSTLKLLQFSVSYRLLKLHNVFDVIISPSNFLRTTFINYGIKQEIQVIRNPANFKELKRDKTAVTSNEINIVYVGRLSPEKGILEFIDNLNKKCTLDVNLHIYGKGDIENEIESQKRTLRTGFKIFNHGFINSSFILDTISQYDIFVLPSLWYENAPLSIVEAGIAGLPVLVPNSGGLLEMAKLTKYFFPYEYNEENYNVIIEKAFLFKGKNEIIDKHIFSEENYMQKIYQLYT
ncbi:glycosyltransferase [Klebsiella pneumoniae]|uniref:glycosyltransferase n=1 Tax=Klebsiella pneumoniae TaxID=573 RepID=UPI0023B14740|nr:glycosyltransferase [Klebsiella pneumoniae]WEE33336.1 glycosyltransferase [Klebsiella pneumoniae subsp. pneumoniae]